MVFIRLNRAAFAKLAIICILALPAICNATTVRLTTSLGAIDIAMYDTAVPRTVANFLACVNSVRARATWLFCLDQRCH